jgi:hypothetical protein
MHIPPTPPKTSQKHGQQNQTAILMERKRANANKLILKIAKKLLINGPSTIMVRSANSIYIMTFGCFINQAEGAIFELHAESYFAFFSFVV